jgi:hypothetical protein
MHFVLSFTQPVVLSTLVALPSGLQTSDAQSLPFAWQKRLSALCVGRANRCGSHASVVHATLSSRSAKTHAAAPSLVASHQRHFAWVFCRSSDDQPPGLGTDGLLRQPAAMAPAESGVTMHPSFGSHFVSKHGLLLEPQSAAPDSFLHVPPFAPGTQLSAVHTLASLQVFPHEPQWLKSWVRSTQAPAQLVNPEGHASMHAPEPSAVGLHTSPLAHAVPHVPQFAGSFETSTQDFPQACRGKVQLVTHSPLSQSSLLDVSHALPQLPQWLAEV